jgi:hypothetical protein
MRQRLDLFWGILASMYIGNAMLLVLNMPIIGMSVQVLKLLLFAASPCRGASSDRRAREKLLLGLRELG